MKEASKIATEKVSTENKKLLEGHNKNFNKSAQNAIKYKTDIETLNNQISGLKTYDGNNKKIGEIEKKLINSKETKQIEKLKAEKTRLQKENKSIAKSYYSSTGEKYDGKGEIKFKKGETIDSKIKELKNRKIETQAKYTSSIKETKNQYEKMLSLLPESQKKEISSAEKKLADSGQEIFKLHKQKEVQNRDYNTVMNKFRNERKELQKSLKNYKEGSTEYKEAHKKLESLEKTIDLKVKKHNQFEKNLHLKEQDHIKLRKNLDTTRTKAGIKLNINDSFTAGQQSKADVVDNMYVGKIPPGTSSVEDMISKAKLTGEIAKSNISLSQLKEANSIGTTITVGDIKELGGTQKGAQGFTQGSRIVLSDKGVSGTVTHEMAHVVQNRKIVDVNGKVNKLYEAKKKTGGFASKYSAKSEKEYFAEGVRLYNSASGRKELKEKDPSLHSLMKDLENKGKLKDGIKQRSFEGEQPESADILKQWDKKPSEKISSTLGTEKDYFILQGGKAGKLKETVGDKIHKAMVGNKKDEKTILNVLKEDGNTAVKDYREKYGRDLLKDLKSELGETGWKKAEHVLSKGKDNQITRQEASTKQTSGQIKTEQVQKASTGESQHQKVTVQKQDSQQSVPQQPTLSKSTEAKLEKGKITLPGKKINKQMSRKTVIEQSTAHKVENKRNSDK